MRNNKKYTGITFPFVSDENNKLFNLDSTFKESIKSKIAVLLSVKQGERFMKPKMGLDLESYRFEPLIDKTALAMVDEIKNILKLYIPSVEIVNITYDVDDNQLMISLVIYYSISKGIFKTNDELILSFN